MDVEKILTAVKKGELSIESASDLFKKMPYEEMGFAKLDHHRKLRSGFGEVIFCSNKKTDHLVAIFQKFYDSDENVLGTRANFEQFLAVKEKIPMAEFDDISRIIKIVKEPPEKMEHIIAICTGGTADIGVAEEAAQVAEFFGGNVQRFYDIGIAGIHRIFNNIDAIREAKVVIAIAGMEGALASVLAGLVENPVIAVPTSVGYGTSFSGVAPLLTMLNSCAEGMAVVNIDNGFGAAYLAAQICRMCK